MKATLLLVHLTAVALGGDPPAADRFGDPVPQGAVARLGFVRTGDRSPLNTAAGPLAAFTPDGRLFASACFDRVYVWDVTTGRVRYRFQLPGVSRLVFTGDGRALLVGQGARLDLASGRQTPPAVTSLRSWDNPIVSPGGRWLIDPKGDVWDLPAGKRVSGPLPVTKPHVTAAFTADERRVFLAGTDSKGGNDEYHLELWDVAAGKRERTFDGFLGTSIACSPDGRTVAAALQIPDPKVINKWTYTLALYDTEAGRERLRLPAGPTPILGPVFSPDGKRLAAILAFEGLGLWDAATGKAIHTWKYQPDHVHSLAFSPDGRWVGACGANGTALLWDVTTGRPRFLSEEVPYRVTDLLFSNDGKQLVAGYTDGHIRFWDLATQEVRYQFRYGESPAYSTIANLGWAGPSGPLIFRTYAKPPGEFRLLDWKTGRDVPLSLGKGVELQAVSAASRTLAVGPPRPDLHDLAWRPLTPEQLQAARREVEQRPELKGYRVITPTPAREATSVGLGRFGRGGLGAFGPDEVFVPARVVAVSADGRYTVESVMTLAGSPMTNMGTYWMPKGLRLVNAATGRGLYELPRTSPQVTFAPNGWALVPQPAEKDSEVSLLETRTGKPRWRAAPGRRVGSATFSPDGRLVAVTGYEEDALHFLDAATGKLVAEYKPGRLDSGTDPLAFSADGKLLARPAADGTVLIWRVPALPSPEGGELTADELAAAWRDLASDDAAVAFRALVRLAEAPKSALPLLRRELLQKENKGRIERLIAGLDSAEFADRERSARELVALGAIARPYVARALRPGISLEARTRLDKMLTAIGDPFATPAGLRQLRAVEALERIGSADARRVLEALAAGPADDPLSREARLTIERLQR